MGRTCLLIPDLGLEMPPHTKIELQLLLYQFLVNMVDVKLLAENINTIKNNVLY
jgi:hypothetical protein